MVGLPSSYFSVWRYCLYVFMLFSVVLFFCCCLIMICVTDTYSLFLLSMFIVCVSLFSYFVICFVLLCYMLFCLYVYLSLCIIIPS